MLSPPKPALPRAIAARARANSLWLGAQPMQDLFKKLSADELFAALLAAAAHDVAHPGVNNAFMVEGAYPVAARCGDTQQQRQIF